MYSVYFKDSDTGWSVGGYEHYLGNHGIILRTTDGGNNWTSQSPSDAGQLYSIYFIDSNTGWTVGDYGTILKTSDGGDNWISQNYDPTNVFSSVYFIDSNTGWVVGYGGKILKTTDGGNNWIYKSSGTTSQLFSVYFTDSNTGWAVGYYGIILKTTDGGNNWISQSSGTTRYLYSVYFKDSNTGWAAGATAWEAVVALKTRFGIHLTNALFCISVEIGSRHSRFDLFRNFLEYRCHDFGGLPHDVDFAFGFDFNPVALVFQGGSTIGLAAGFRLFRRGCCQQIGKDVHNLSVSN